MAENAKPRRWPNFRRRMQWKVTSVLAACVVLFAILYVPIDILGPLADRFGEVGKAMIRGGLSLPVAVLLRWILFAQDHLANGKSRAAKFFRYHYPSSYAMHVHGLGETQAMHAWFRLYNSWHQRDHEYNHLYALNTHRTYSLRLIYYLKRVLLVFFVLGLLSIVWQLFSPISEGIVTPMAAQIAVLVMVGALTLWIHLSNSFELTEGENLSYYDRYSATGAYRKYKELQGQLWMVFEEQSLGNARDE